MKMLKEDADRFQNSFLKNVKTSSFQGNANGLLVLVIIKAAQEHLVDNPLKAGVDALLLLILWELGILHPQLGVMINAFGCRIERMNYNS